MSALSIRKLPQALEKALLREVKAGERTKTEIVIEALEEKFHIGKKSRKQAKIREFFGKMKPAEYESFKKATGGFSEIEKDFWE